MSNQSSCRILKFLGMDVKCDKSPSVPAKSSSTDEEKLGDIPCASREIIPDLPGKWKLEANGDCVYTSIMSGEGGGGKFNF